MNYSELITKNEIKSKINCKFIEADIFIRMIDKGMSHDYIFPQYLEVFKKYEKTLNNKNIYFEKYFEKIEDKNKEEIKTMFEKFSDLCFDTLNNVKVDKFKKLISKNININEETIDLLRELATLTNEDFFEKHIAQKSVSYKLEDLHQSLNQNISLLKNWNLDSQLELIKSYNTTIIFSDNNSILFEINDAETSLALGVKNWCISRDESTFDDYRSNFERIYFNYDFNENTPSTLKITAYVVDSDGNEVEYQDKLNRKISNYYLLDKIKSYFKPLTLEEYKQKIENLEPNEQYLKILQKGFDEKKYSYLRDEIDIDYLFSQNPYLIKDIIEHNKHLLKEKVFFDVALDYVLERTDTFKNLEKILFCKETRNHYKKSNHIFKDTILHLHQFNYDEEDFDISKKLLKLINNNFLTQLKKELLNKDSIYFSYNNPINKLSKEEQSELFDQEFFNLLFERNIDSITAILRTVPKEYFNNIDEVYIKQLIKNNPEKFDLNSQLQISNLIEIFIIDTEKKQEIIESFLKRPRNVMTNKEIIKSLNVELNNIETEIFLYQLFFELPKKNVELMNIEEKKEEANYVSLPKSFITKILSNIPLDKNTLINFYNDNKDFLCESRSILAKEALEEFINQNNHILRNKITI